MEGPSRSVGTTSVGSSNAGNLGALLNWLLLGVGLLALIASSIVPLRPYLSLVWVSWFVAGALLMAVAQCVVAVVRLLLRTAGLKGA